MAVRFRPCVAFVLAMLFLCSWTRCDAADEAGPLVAEVKVQGNRLVSEQAIKSQLRVSEGKAYDPADVQKDIERLFSLGYFSDIQVDVEEVDGGLVITYIVAERKLVREVQVQGNAKVPTEDILALISLKKGGTYLSKRLESDREAIRGLYEKRGYPMASVQAKVRTVSPGTVEIIYSIDERKRARVRSIHISGNSQFSDRQVRRMMKTRKAFLWFRGSYDESKFQQDLERIVAFYGDQGYVEAAIVDTRIEYRDENKDIHISIVIEEGPQYFVSSTTITGNTVFDDAELLAHVALEAGDVYSRKDSERSANAIQSLYFDNGYILAAARVRPSLHRDTHSVDLDYRVTERNLIYVNKIRATGNVRTKDEVLRRELMIFPGERFDGQKIRLSQRGLRNLGYFSTIDVSTEPTEEPNRRDLIIEVEEQQTGRFMFGVGFSSNDEFFGQFSLTQNNFDLTNFPTFTGAGQTLVMAVRPGNVLSEYRLGWTDPWLMGRPLSFGFDLFLRDRDYDEYDQSRAGASIRFGKRLTPFTTGTLRYALEAVDISDIELDTPSIIAREEGERTKSSLALLLVNDTRDNFSNPSQGHRYRVTLELAGGPFGADTDFIKVISQNTWYFPVFERWERQFVLMLRGELGVVEEYGDSDLVPVFERFFVGGVGSVRGYDFRDIGPKEHDDPEGGKAMVEATAELAVPLVPNIRAYLFLDAGQAYEEFSDVAETKLNTSAGVGIGLVTPLGPIRVDYGVPLNPDPDQGGGQLHFVTGILF